MKVEIEIPDYVVEHMSKNQLNGNNNIPENLVKEIISLGMLVCYQKELINNDENPDTVKIAERWLKEEQADKKLAKACLKIFKVLEDDIDEILEEV